jgi:hypothetical protein
MYRTGTEHISTTQSLLAKNDTVIDFFDDQSSSHDDSNDSAVSRKTFATLFAHETHAAPSQATPSQLYALIIRNPTKYHALQQLSLTKAKI